MKWLIVPRGQYLHRHFGRVTVLSIGGRKAEISYQRDRAEEVGLWRHRKIIINPHNPKDRKYEIIAVTKAEAEKLKELGEELLPPWRTTVDLKYFRRGIKKQLRRGIPTLQNFGDGWRETLVRYAIPKTHIVILKKAAVYTRVEG